MSNSIAELFDTVEVATTADDDTTVSLPSDFSDMLQEQMNEFMTSLRLMMSELVTLYKSCKGRKDTFDSREAVRLPYDLDKRNIDFWVRLHNTASSQFKASLRIASDKLEKLPFYLTVNLYKSNIWGPNLRFTEWVIVVNADFAKEGCLHTFNKWLKSSGTEKTHKFLCCTETVTVYPSTTFEEWKKQQQQKTLRPPSATMSMDATAANDDEDDVSAENEVRRLLFFADSRAEESMNYQRLKQ
jgi:hypothetical protein